MFVTRACRPSDFSYKPEAKQTSMLVVARLWDDSDDKDDLLRLVKENIEDPQTGTPLSADRLTSFDLLSQR